MTSAYLHETKLLNGAAGTPSSLVSAPTREKGLIDSLPSHERGVDAAGPDRAPTVRF